MTVLIERTEQHGSLIVLFNETYPDYVNRLRREIISQRPNMQALELEERLAKDSPYTFHDAVLAQSETTKRFGPVTFESLPEHTQRYLRKNCPNTLPL